MLQQAAQLLQGNLHAGSSGCFRQWPAPAALQRVQQQLASLPDSSSSSSSSEEEVAQPEALAQPTLAVTTAPPEVEPVTAAPVETLPLQSLPQLMQTQQPQQRQIAVCTGKSCRKKGSEAVLAELQQQAAGDPSISVTSCKCLDKCKLGPNVRMPGSSAGAKKQVLSGVGPMHFPDILGKQPVPQLAPA